jgi:hypothetical protein
MSAAAASVRHRAAAHLTRHGEELNRLRPVLVPSLTQLHLPPSAPDNGGNEGHSYYCRRPAFPDHLPPLSGPNERARP